MVDRDKFWESKSLFEMSHDEWESICDGCAKCCLVQLEDEDTGNLLFTDVACHMLDSGNCRCTDYANRSTRVPNCMTLTKQNVMQAAEFTPSTCAYRLLLENKPLPSWHHLSSGDSHSVHNSGNSVRMRVQSEHDIAPNDLQDHVVDWPE